MDLDDRGDRPKTSLGDVDAADCVCVLVVLTIFLPADQIIPGPGLPPTDILSALLAFLWLGLQLGQNMPIAKGPTPVRTVLLLLLLALATSFALSTYGYLTDAEVQNSVHKMVLFISVIGTALFIGDTVRTREGSRRIARMMVMCTAVVAVFGIAESLIGQNFVAQVPIPGLTPTNFAGFTQAPRDGLVRAQSTAGHPIEFGVLCAMVLPFAMYFAAGSRRTGLLRLSWLPVGVLCAGCVFSVSRSAIIGLMIVVVVVLAGASSKERWRNVSYIVAATVVLWLAVPRVLSVLTGFFLSSSNDPSVSSRTDDYAAVAEQLGRDPLFGKGPGTWFAPVHRILDNQYLVSAVEIGLVGLVAVLLTFVVSIARSFRMCRTRSSQDRRYGLACFAAMSVAAVTYATFDFGSFSTVNTLAFVIIGMIMASDRHNSLGERRRT